MFLMGATFYQWIKLLYQNRFKVGIKHLPKVLAITFTSLLFTPFYYLEKLLFYFKIKKTKVSKPPIFIIGHWRSGTTHLQNLILQDGRFGHLDLVEATFPHQFLMGYWFYKLVMAPFIPKTRPMDNMKMRARTPQEHEFALTNYCLLSPLTGLFFPKNREHYLKYGDFEKASEKELEQWKKAFEYLMKKLTIKEKGKQLLLKNPLDTFRMRLVHEMYPEAKFIHIYRNPYEVFFSTKKLHRTNTALFLLQEVDYDQDQFIFNLYKEMYKQFHEDLKTIPESSVIQIKYEDLCQNPHEELEKIYNHFSIDDYATVKNKIELYLESLRDYKVGEYDITEEEKERIYSEWKETIDRWRYEKPQKIEKEITS